MCKMGIGMDDTGRKKKTLKRVFALLYNTYSERGGYKREKDCKKMRITTLIV